METKERLRLEQILHEDEVAVSSCVRLAEYMFQANVVQSITQTAEEQLKSGKAKNLSLHLCAFQLGFALVSICFSKGEAFELRNGSEETKMAFSTSSFGADQSQGHRVLDAASVWLREGSRDGKRMLDRKNMNSTYGGSLSARSMDKISDPARKIVVASGALTSREMRRIQEEEAMPGSQNLTAPLSVDERKLVDLLQSMAAKAAQRFPSMSDVFRGLDPDRDGKIDLSELRYFFRTCGQTDVVADLWPKDHGWLLEIAGSRSQ
eukprot:symbB.v1.2.000048.t1/scaffold2.1/size812218/2